MRISDWSSDVCSSDLDPDELGTFDVVVCGSLMLHLRDPLRALEAVRSVTSGVFLSSEQIELWLSVLGRGRPLFQLNGSGADCQWFNFNAAGHKRMLSAAGFDVERVSKPYHVRFAPPPTPPPTFRHRVTMLRVRAAPPTLDEGLAPRAPLAP